MLVFIPNIVQRGVCTVGMLYRLDCRSAVLNLLAETQTFGSVSDPNLIFRLVHIPIFELFSTNFYFIFSNLWVIFSDWFAKLADNRKILSYFFKAKLVDNGKLTVKYTFVEILDINFFSTEITQNTPRPKS